MNTGTTSGKRGPRPRNVDWRGGMLGMCLLLLLCSGCVSSRPRVKLAVANAGNKPVTDVCLLVDGETFYEAEEIPAHDIGDYRRVRGEMAARASRLEWQDPLQGSITNTITINDPLPEGFRGRIVIQIGRSGEVKVFRMGEDGSQGASIPWGFSERFDGTMTVPGMSKP